MLSTDTAYFITGTDTNVGKTYVATQLLQWLAKNNYQTIGLKPVACDAVKTEYGLRNADALNLQQAATIDLPYEKVNPLIYEDPISPHLPAMLGNAPKASIPELVANCQQTLNQPADVSLIEGAGGWLCPLTETQTMADFAVALSIPIILVVGIKLGCLNHTLLTWQSLQNYPIKVAGWIANCVSPNMLYPAENIQTLQQFLPVPLLAKVAYGGNIETFDAFTQQLAHRTGEEHSNECLSKT